jgi:hypothetical protein
MFNQMQLYQNVANLIAQIKGSIEPDSWDDRGGAGTIFFDPRTMTLAVRQSAEVHLVLRSGLR